MRETPHYAPLDLAPLDLKHPDPPQGFRAESRLIGVQSARLRVPLRDWRGDRAGAKVFRSRRRFWTPETCRISGQYPPLPACSASHTDQAVIASSTVRARVNAVSRRSINVEASASTIAASGWSHHVERPGQALDPHRAYQRGAAGNEVTFMHDGRDVSLGDGVPHHAKAR